LAAIGAAFAPAVRADEHDKRTVITFNAPVEIPGVHLSGWGTLPAGTYVFKLLDSSSDRNIVQIFSKDEKTVYATILAIPNYRLKATSKTVMTFNEAPAGQPEALRAWFYPGDNYGQEFVYSKSKAVEISKITSTPVLFVPDEIAVEVSEPVTIHAPVVAQLRTAPVMAVQPTGQEVVLAEVITPAPMPMQAEPVRKLPTTASDLPLFGLLGLVALTGVLATSVVLKRLQ
jgi:hypothetical protein